MKKIIKYNISICLLFLVVSSCQKDDICPEGSETTPLLVIEFYDADDRETLKAVQNLSVYAVNLNDTLSLLGPVTVDRIEIPLRTDTTNTNYRFVIEPDGEEMNSDTISFFYSPTTEYLNRACGFKVNYSNLRLDLKEDGDNWIRTTDIPINQIENDSTVHVEIYH
ncbi:MAG TPA: DUF6452 family protein [Salinimicrobium sp.]|nr:DUF6452 family protein [Salinimicrobium sp.]